MATPWYRERGYKGNLTAKEKRILDSIREREKHPAFEDEIPEHVDSYISGLEFELHNLKGTIYVAQALFLVVIGLLLIYTNWSGGFGYSTLTQASGWNYFFGTLLISIGIYAFIRGTRQSMTDILSHEGLKKTWEIDYIVGRKQRQTDQRAHGESSEI